MARYRQGSLVADVITIAAKLPWPVGVALATVAFVGFGIVAEIELPTTGKPGEMGGLFVRQIVRTAAPIAKWFIPILLLIGSAASAFKQWRRARHYGDVAAADSASALGRMTWQDFERLVGDYFRCRGYVVREIGGGGADGGVDLIARRGDDKYLIQCKQWKALRVGVVPVRELYGVVAARHAAGGFVVTSGSFTTEAFQFAAGTSIELIDGGKLASAISRQARSPAPFGDVAIDEDPTPQVAPQCPECQAQMVLRTAKVGKYAGSQFWGCARFPKCRGTRPTT